MQMYMFQMAFELIVNKKQVTDKVNQLIHARTNVYPVSIPSLGDASELTSPNDSPRMCPSNFLHP